MSAPTLLRPLAAMGLALVLALAPTAATATTPSVPDPGATEAVEPAPAEDGTAPTGGEVEPTEGGSTGDTTGDADQPGSFEPLAGRGGSWTSWPGGGTYSEGSISVLNPVVLRATFSLTSVVGGYAVLERANGTQVGSRVDISGIRGDKSLSWALASLETGMYRIRAVTGAGMGTTTYSPYFTLYEQLLQPRFITQPQNLEIALGQTAVISANASIDAAPVATVQGQVSSDGGATWRDEGGPQGAVLASIVVTGSATNNGWKYRFVATRASSDVYVRPASATSEMVTLTVVPAPVVTAHPVNAVVTEGAYPSFDAAATGYDTVQWQTRSSSAGLWSTVAGATGTAYAWPAGATLAQDGTQIRAVFTNASGSAATNPATLTVNAAVPAIASHPQDRTVTEGQAAGFTVGYTGSGASVRWETRASASGSWSTVAAATGTTYTVPGATFAMSGSQYRAVVTNSAGSATTNVATLTVNALAPVITGHPVDRTVVEGGSAVFTAAATSSAAVSWQWQSRAGSTGAWASLAGATSSTYTVSSVTLASSGRQYRAVATSVAGSATTNAATLMIAPALPQVVEHPADVTVTELQPARFTAGYTGTDAPVVVSWEFRSGPSDSWSTVLGASSRTLTESRSTLLMDGRQYRAVFTNDAGVVRTDIATLTVNAIPPLITLHPVDRTVVEGGSVTFTATAGSNAAVSWQWQSRAGSTGSWADLAGATSSTYTVSGATLASSGRQYRAVVTSIAGSATTDAATLTVTAVAPQITGHPVTRTVTEGQSASFAVAYTGSEASVRWELRASGSGSWSTVAGATGTTYTVPITTLAMSGSQYRAVVTNSAGSATTNAAVLIVDALAPVITGHPVDRTVVEGGSATFSAEATSSVAVSWRWESRVDSTGSWSSIAGATSSTYTVPSATLASSGRQYRAVATSIAGSATTDAATLTVTPAAPRITGHPVDRTVTEGEPASFTAAYAGSEVSVQWESRAGVSGSWSTVAGATGATYTVPSTTLAMSGRQYRAVFTNAAGSATTDAATLTVNALAPVITGHPGDRTVTEGGSAVLSAGVSSSVAVSWRWESRDGGTGSWSIVDGATSSLYRVTAATLAMSGRQYRAVATSAGGSATTDVATLTVTPALPRVTGHPQDARVPEGGSTTFGAAYEGTAAQVSWQWQSRAGAGGTWSDVPGATLSTYTVSGVTLLQSGQQYRAVLSSIAGSVETDAATMTVDVAVPTVVTDPQDVTVTEGEPTTFSAAYGGTGAPVSVRWESRLSSSGPWEAIEGATGLTYTVDATTLAMDGRHYRAVFTNSAGDRESGEALLTVTPAAPHVTEHPRDQAVTEGGSATFSAAYGGTESVVSVRWYRMGPAGSWVVIEGATSPTYTVEGATLAMNGDRFRAEFRNTSGSVTTTAAMLRVDPVPPTVTEHPQDVTVLEGGSATFSAAYSGTEYPTVTSWQYSADGGVTFAEVPPGVGTVGDGELVVDPVEMDMQGWRFRVGFSNAAGEAWSDAATLTVLRARPLHLMVTPRAVQVDALPGRG